MNISFFKTQEQILAQTKDVTRRIRWLKLKGGEILQPVVKGQGIPKGEKIQKLGGPIKVVSVIRERLDEITDDEVIREGFPQYNRSQFICMFMKLNGCNWSEPVTRIEFVYL